MSKEIERLHIQFIKEKLDRRTILEQLAEESAELTQAALKLVRAEGLSNNPTPIEDDEAFNNLLEEIEDVIACLKLLDIDVTIAATSDNPKWERWVNRLKESEG